MFSDRVLAGKKILITGGGSGIGKSLGTRFLELGAEIVICGRREEVLKGTVAEWTTSGGRASYVVCDVRLPDKVDAMFNEQVARIPVGRVGQHAELANLCSYLMSEYAGFINGDCITMDGGAGLVEGGGGTVQYLHSWGPEQWEEFRARAATTVASSSNKA